MATPEVRADPAALAESEKLAEAFRIFNQASEELAGTYNILQAQVTRLTAELAAANAERDKLRAEAERNERLAAMGEMAAQLAHQLRTPLAAALLYAGNLENPDLAQASRVSIAQKTVARLKHLERLIQDMLMFARGEVLGRETFALSDLLADLASTFEPLARMRGIDFRAAPAAADARLTGNRKALTGAVTNLLENAMQVVEPGNGEVALAVRRTDTHWLFSVQDNGPGMAPDVITRLFQPFFTTRTEGTGLGLAIARGVARAHGGGIDVISAPGKGAEFIMTILPGEEVPATDQICQNTTP